MNVLISKRLPVGTDMNVLILMEVMGVARMVLEIQI